MSTRWRLAAVLLAALASLGLISPAPATAAATTTFRIHGNLFTTMDAAVSPNPLNPLIIASTAHRSTVSSLGRVSLSQRELVQPAPTSPPFGQQSYFGTIVSDPSTRAYFQARNGDRLYFTFTGTYRSFAADSGPAPWPIAYRGTMTFTGGTGRFAHATGTACFSGTYSFLTNEGHYAFRGAITLPHRH